MRPATVDATRRHQPKVDRRDLRDQRGDATLIVHVGQRDRAIEVFANGSNIGRAASGQDLDAEIPAGTSVIQFKDVATGQVVKEKKVSLKPGETKRLRP
jgi:hypothetical protein